MKTYITLITALLFSIFAKAQLETPALSPAAIIKQTVGLTDIEITYARPSVKGRAIFGKDGLLPSGEVWRLGANAATSFSFSTDLTLAGQPLKKGNYTMLVTTNAATWEFSVFTYDSTDWNDYVAQTPVLTFSAPIQKTTTLQESFEISVQEITSTTARLEINWEHTLIVIPIALPTTETVMASIESTMKGPSLNDYFQAALFMHENKQDLSQALVYIQEVTKTDKALFFVVYREALILKDLGKNEEALQSAKRALKLAKEAKNNDFIRFNEQLIASLS